MIVTQPVAAAVVQGPSFFDDTNPAFVYSGPWSTGDGSVGDMMQTLHGASSLNSSVKLTFNGERTPALPSRSTSDERARRDIYRRLWEVAHNNWPGVSRCIYGGQRHAVHV